MRKSGSKLLTAILAFILGFIFAIIAEAGLIFGVVWFVMNKDIDTILSTIGIKNKDEDGNNIYINTNPEEGGVSNIKELFEGLQGLVYKDGEVVALGKSFDDFEKLIPATSIVLGFVYDAVGDYIELDRDEFEGTPLSGLAQVLSNSVLEVKTAALLEKLGMDSIVGEDANTIVKSLVTGAECEYATVYTGVAEQDGESAELKFPVLYDFYAYDSEIGYNLERSINNTNAYPANFNRNYDWLCPVERDEEDGDLTYQRFMLYYVPCRVTENGIEEAEYRVAEHTVTDGSGDNEKTFRFQIIEYGEDTDFIAVKPDASGKFIIDYAEVYASLNPDAADLSERFEGYSYYQPYAREYYYTVKNTSTERYELKTVSGKNYFRNNAGKLMQMDALTLYDIVNDAFAPLDSVLVTEVVGQNSEVAYKVFGNTTLGALMRGEVDFNKLSEDMEVGAFVTNVAPSNKVMAYIVHRISDLVQIAPDYYSAVYDKDGENEQEVEVEIRDGYIYAVYAENGSVMVGVKVKEVAALANNMPITALMDIAVDEPIMTYLGYGVRGVTKAAEGSAYDYKGVVKVGGIWKECYITAEEKGGTEIVTSVWYTDGEQKISVSGTKVSAVSDRVSSFTKDLTIGDVIDVGAADNKLLSTIADTPIYLLDTRISEVTVGEMFTEEQLSASAMLRQLKGTKLSELDTAIDKLFIQSVYAEEVYGVAKDSVPQLATEYHSDRLYYTMDGDAFKLAGSVDNPPADDPDYDNALGHITQAEFESGEYYTYGGATGMWKIVLYHDGVEKAYTMNNFNNMVSSCAANVNNAKLYDLLDAGILQTTRAELSKSFNNHILGELTLSELIEIVLELSADS